MPVPAPSLNNEHHFVRNKKERSTVGCGVWRHHATAPTNVGLAARWSPLNPTCVTLVNLESLVQDPLSLVNMIFTYPPQPFHALRKRTETRRHRPVNKRRRIYHGELSHCSSSCLLPIVPVQVAKLETLNCETGRLFHVTFSLFLSTLP